MSRYVYAPSGRNAREWAVDAAREACEMGQDYAAVEGGYPVLIVTREAVMIAAEEMAKLLRGVAAIIDSWEVADEADTAIRIYEVIHR